MITKKFESELLVMPLSAARVVQEAIPEETDAESLREIIKFARHLVAGWDRVWTLSERRLEILEVVERIAKEKEA